MLNIIRSEQILECSRPEAWRFISDPKNLATITPDYMGFKLLNGPDDSTYQGQIIEYSLKPLLSLPMHWVTEITHVKEGEYFVDEQRFGPYAFWHHQHHLSDAEGGVLMRDIVHYKPPFGLLGKLANHLIIKRQLTGIFSYRKHKLDELFNKNK